MGMRATLSSVLVFAAVAAFGQVQNPRSIPLSGAAGPDEIAFATLELGSSDAYPAGGVIVIKSKAEWTAYLLKIHDTGKHSVVDWKTQEVLAVHLASSPSAANGFTVQRLKRKTDGVEVQILLNKPPRGSGARQARTIVGSVAPFVLIATQKFDSPIETTIVDH